MMITLNEQEIDSLKDQLLRISIESRKQSQRKYSIHNMAQKAAMIIKKAERRQKLNS